jgi:acetyl esterase/lipase
MRLLIGLGGLVPLPADAMVTPVTFRVARRGLRGILAAPDAAEDGRRELQGEWVVGRRLWRRLQAEWKAQQAGAEKGAEKDAKDTGKGKGRVVLFLHGGVWNGCSLTVHDGLTVSFRRILLLLRCDASTHHHPAV